MFVCGLRPHCICVYLSGCRVSVLSGEGGSASVVGLVFCFIDLVVICLSLSLSADLAAVNPSHTDLRYFGTGKSRARRRRIGSQVLLAPSLPPSSPSLSLLSSRPRPSPPCFYVHIPVEERKHKNTKTKGHCFFSPSSVVGPTHFTHFRRRVLTPACSKPRCSLSIAC